MVLTVHGRVCEKRAAQQQCGLIDHHRCLVVHRAPTQLRCVALKDAVSNLQIANQGLQVSSKWEGEGEYEQVKFIEIAASCLPLVRIEAMRQRWSKQIATSGTASAKTGMQGKHHRAGIDKHKCGNSSDEL